MKIVINRCYGGFGLSHAAILRYAAIKGWKVYPEKGEWGGYTYWLVPKKDRIKPSEENFHMLPFEERKAYNDAYAAQVMGTRTFERNDPVLVQVVQELGKAANSDFADLAIFTIPDDVKWDIHEYDGMEHVEEQHRTWGADK